MKNLLTAVLLLSSVHLSFGGGTIGGKDTDKLSQKAALFITSMQSILKDTSQKDLKVLQDSLNGVDASKRESVKSFMEVVNRAFSLQLKQKKD